VNQFAKRQPSWPVAVGNSNGGQFFSRGLGMEDLTKEVLAAIELHPGVRFEGLTRLVPPVREKELLRAVEWLTRHHMICINGDRLYPMPIEAEDSMQFESTVVVVGIACALGVFGLIAWLIMTFRANP
jgi:hypothetical protein